MGAFRGGEGLSNRGQCHFYLAPKFFDASPSHLQLLRVQQRVPSHINPGASREASAGRLFRFVGNLSFPSKIFEEYTNSISARFAGWSSGARRRGASQPEFFASPGDLIQPTTVYSGHRGQLSARGWWQANFRDWLLNVRVASWSTQVASITVNRLAAFRKSGSQTRRRA